MRVSHNLSLAVEIFWPNRILNIYNPYLSICFVSVSKKKKKKKKNQHTDRVVSFRGRSTGGAVQVLHERVPHFVRDLNPPLSLQIW